MAEAGHRDGELEPVQLGGQLGDFRGGLFLFLPDGAGFGRSAVGAGVGHGVTIGGSLCNRRSGGARRRSGGQVLGKSAAR